MEEKVGKLVRLPPGFRFHPTDEELVVEYLKRKVMGCPLPAAAAAASSINVNNIIPEVELVCKRDPWDLPLAGGGDCRYLFSTRELKYPNGNNMRSNRATASGYWKASGNDKPIVRSVSSSSPHSNKQIVGMKKTLVFYTGKPPHGLRTHWIMHEYRLLPPQENWVLCRIFLKKKKKKKKSGNKFEEEKSGQLNTQVLVSYDFLEKHTPPPHHLKNIATFPSSSSGSSGITEISSNRSEEHEQSSTTCSSFIPSKMKTLP